VEIALVLGLILVHGLVVFVKAALQGSLKSRLTERSAQGDRGAAAALRLVEEPGPRDWLLRLLRFVVAMGLGWLALSGMAWQIRALLARVNLDGSWLDWLASGLALVAVLLATAVLGDAVPRRLALHAPERNAAFCARPLALMVGLFQPAVSFLEGSARWLTRWVGVREPKEPPVSQEEIEVLVHEGAKAGVFEDEEHELIKRVFRFTDRRARSLMTPRTNIVWIDVADPPEEVRRKVTASSHAQFPVCDGTLDNLLGIVRAKDFLTEGLELEQFRVKGRLAMPLFIFEGTRGLKVLELFKKSPVRIAVVLDEYGAVQGLLTLTDLLEAIVGDMPAAGDEAEEPRAVQRGDGSWLFDGLTPLEEFQERLQLTSLPTGDYHTLAGLVVTQLGRIPRIADALEIAGLRIEVVDMDGNRVDRLLVTRVGGESV